MKFGDKLKSLRTQKGLTQEAFAQKLNISRSAIAKWETNNGIPEIDSLKLISRFFHICLDELLDDERGISIAEASEKNVESEYSGYKCDIDLVGWNDGVYDAVILSEDLDFFFYQRIEKGRIIHGMLGKKYIKTIKQSSLNDSFQYSDNINRKYFCNKHVLIEIAHKEGLLKGFFDFRNDDYLDVIIDSFEGLRVILKYDREIDLDNITKIEEINT